ncbi:MAG: hypothetical protein CVU23_05360, partial [Betaproteobacteria bacterium HGW-Betaproteobacteria-17]
MILLLTSSDEVAAAALYAELFAMGETALRVNVDSFATEFDVVLEGPPDSWRIAPRNGGAPVAARDVRAVWCRGLGIVAEVPECDPRAALFVRSEWTRALEAWLYALRCRWVNDFRISRVATNRVRQMALAQHLGLSVPSWSVLTRRADLERFVDGRQVTWVVKQINEGGSKECGDFVTFTKSITDPLRVLANDIDKLPILIQEAVRPRVVVRAYVIGERCLSAASTLDLDRLGGLDSRLAGPHEAYYCPCELPADVEHA